MRAAELRDRVVAVLVEDALVELVGAPDAQRLLGVPFVADLIEKLVEEEPAQRLRRARVAGEQRSLHDLRQVAQREHRSIEIREVRRQQAPLVF